MLGRGRFSNIFQALELKSGCLLAVKQIILKNLDNFHLTKFKLKIEEIVDIEHKNLILYHNIEVSPNSCNIVAEFQSGGSRRKLITDFNRFEETLLRAYIVQICDGIKFLHSRHMTHGNLNSQNLILDVYGNIKLSDYGNMNQILETYAVMLVSAVDELLYSE